jgi:hypothetical protein
MDYPFITAVKQAFDQTSEKSGGTVFWRLDQWTKGKSYLVHNNSAVGQAAKSWELLKNNLVSLYKFGGVRQFDISFRESVNDPHPRLFPVDLSTEEAVKAMTKTPGVSGFGIAGLDGEGFGGGIAGLLQIMAEKNAAETEKRIAELEHKHELEKLRDEIKGTKTAGDRFFETFERLLDKPGVPEKILDKFFPEPAQVAGGAASDTATAGDGSTDFSGLIRERIDRKSVV